MNEFSLKNLLWIFSALIEFVHKIIKPRRAVEAHGIVDPHFGSWEDSSFSYFFGDIFLPNRGLVFGQQRKQVAFE